MDQNFFTKMDRNLETNRKDGSKPRVTQEDD